METGGYPVAVNEQHGIAPVHPTLHWSLHCPVHYNDATACCATFPLIKAQRFAVLTGDNTL